MIVKDIMSSSVISVMPNDNLDKVIFIMKSEDIGIVPVCDKQNHLLGIITDRDIVIRYKEDLLSKDIMTRTPITVSSDEGIHDAALKFSKYKVRRLPVLDGERLVGMLSLRDMAKKKVLTVEIGHIIYNICN
ncbi:MAG: CBS domain-containing protein [Firmicutes bacterium]|nr:CBS domain-containing protein [Bacillota bacterium]